MTSSVPFRLAFFNIWRSGSGPGGLARVADLILASAADVIGLSEVMKPADFRVLTALLQLHLPHSAYCPTSYLGIISRYELGSVAGHTPQDKSTPGFSATVAMPEGRARVKVIVCHLSAFPYGPYMLRDGHKVQDVHREEASSTIWSPCHVSSL